MMDRRKFLKLIPAGTLVAVNPGLVFGSNLIQPGKKITILHTNDWHSRIEPFPMDGSRNQGLGGAAKRAALISKIRKEEENVLLFDSGDIFQGTPYFNFFSGELEIKLMSEMSYDAATIGNHDFDGGIENLRDQLNHAEFSMLNANYNLDRTVLKDIVEPYKIIKKDGLKIGVFGVGIELEGLVPKNLFGETQYKDPISKSNLIAEHLKKHHKCDIVICLSHLGFKYNIDYPSDVVLASRSKNIDIILGGHTHTFMKEVHLEKNKIGKNVLINQAGWAGIILGRIDLIFEKEKSIKFVNTSQLKV